MRTTEEILRIIEWEIAEREGFCAKTFASLRSGKASQMDAKMVTRYLSEVRQLKNTLKTFKKGG